jgi:hypothetical protein
MALSQLVMKVILGEIDIDQQIEPARGTGIAAGMKLDFGLGKRAWLDDHAIEAEMGSTLKRRVSSTSDVTKSGKHFDLAGAHAPFFPAAEAAH